LYNDNATAALHRGALDGLEFLPRDLR